AGYIAIRRKMWDPDEFEKLRSIIVRSKSLRSFGALKTNDIINALKHDKKKTGTALNFVLPVETGKVTIVSDVTRNEVLGALDYIFQFQI
ncbi:MAG: hypothetical protein ACRD4B_07770, partial [Acidobacteriota bacterium]